MWHTSETLAAASEITVEKSRIVLFEKTIHAVVNATETENVKFEGESINGLNFSEILGSVVTHEIEHTTNENERTAQKNEDTEAIPKQIQVKMIKELKENKRK